MTNDPIADLLIQIKNGYMVHKEKVNIPHSKIKESLAKLLQRTGYVGKVEMVKEKNFKSISIQLTYNGKKPKLIGVIRESKPGKRVYIDKGEIPRVLGGMGIAIISTVEGLLTDKEAKKKKIGGELLCRVW
jgi:small subunit ribosomal protein S8